MMTQHEPCACSGLNPSCFRCMGSGTVKIGEISIKVNHDSVPSSPPHNPWTSSSGGDVWIVASRGSTWAQFSDAMNLDTAIGRATFNLRVQHEFQQELEWCHFVSVVLRFNLLEESDSEALKRIVLKALEEIDQPFRDNIRIQLGLGRSGLHSRLEAEIRGRIQAVEQDADDQLPARAESEAL